MLTETCAFLHNYFSRDEDKHSGEFEVSGGALMPLDFLEQGQYFRIIGSKFNDGVYQYPAAGLIDEKFKGAIWGMRVPQELVEIDEEIERYKKTDAAKPSPYTSESFEGYSYSKTANANFWENMFYDRLKRWRKYGTN